MRKLLWMLLSAVTVLSMVFFLSGCDEAELPPL